MIGCQTAQDLVVAYLTSFLEEREAQELLGHVALCEGCSNYLREMTWVAEGLSRSLPLVEPPPHLRQQILEQVRREAQAGQRQLRATPRADGDNGYLGSPRPAEKEQGDEPSVRRRAGRRGRWQAVAVVAVAFLLAGQGYFIRQVVQDNRRLQAEMTQSRLEIAAAATVLGEGVIQPQWVLRMDKGDGFEAAWGHATLYSTRYGDVLVLAVGGLPHGEEGGTYRAWLWGVGGPADAGVMRPDGAGFASLIVQLKRFDYHALAITQEPDARPSQEPRGPVVLFAEDLNGR